MSERWEHKLENVTSLDERGLPVFVCPLCGEVRHIAHDDSDSYDDVTSHLDGHPTIDLGAALIEARMWARHGYEIGQRSYSWADEGTAPDWLTR